MKPSTTTVTKRDTVPGQTFCPGSGAWEAGRDSDPYMGALSRPAWKHPKKFKPIGTACSGYDLKYINL